MSGDHENPWNDSTKQYEKIADRPIWPSGYGEDIYSGQAMIELSWLDPRGRRKREWFPEYVRNDRTALLRLPGSPVSLQNVDQISHWLTAAAGTIRNNGQRLLHGRLATEKEILRAEREKQEEASRGLRP